MPKRQGLRLKNDGENLGGAPATPHVIAGWPGYYRADVPTPVGGDGELTLEAARELAATGAVELVDIPDSEVKVAEEQAKADIQAGREGRVAESRGVRARRDRAGAASEERVKAETAATKEA